MNVRALAGLLAPIILVLLICGMAMHITGRDSACAQAGGHLEFSHRAWDGAECTYRKGTP